MMLQLFTAMVLDVILDFPDVDQHRCVSINHLLSYSQFSSHDISNDVANQNM